MSVWVRPDRWTVKHVSLPFPPRSPARHHSEICKYVRGEEWGVSSDVKVRCPASETSGEIPIQLSQSLYLAGFFWYFFCVFSKGVFFSPSPKSNENRQHNHCRALIQYIKMAQGTIHKLCNLNSIFPQSKVKMLLWMRALYLVEHNNLWRQTASKNGHLLFTFYRFFFF